MEANETVSIIDYQENCGPFKSQTEDFIIFLRKLFYLSGLLYLLN